MIHITNEWILFKLFGYGLSITWAESAKYKSFSERYGYRKVYRPLGLKIVLCRPEKKKPHWLGRE